MLKASRKEIQIDFSQANKGLERGVIFTFEHEDETHQFTVRDINEIFENMPAPGSYEYSEYMEADDPRCPYTTPVPRRLLVLMMALLQHGYHNVRAGDALVNYSPTMDQFKDANTVFPSLYVALVQGLSSKTLEHIRDMDYSDMRKDIPSDMGLRFFHQLTSDRAENFSFDPREKRVYELQEHPYPGEDLRPSN